MFLHLVLRAYSELPYHKNCQDALNSANFKYLHNLFFIRSASALTEMEETSRSGVVTEH
jgi:hypothetical protein